VREEAVDFAKNGSYLVFTLIRQHAGVFATYLREKARELLPADASEPEILEKIEWLAAKFMGRWRDGTPVTQARTQADRPAAPSLANNFNYSDDVEGFGCPHAAHIRMANPRSQPIESFKSPTPVLVRRGMPYGPELVGEAEDGVDRGLVGLFICADLQDQYLKLVRWLNRSDFSPAPLRRLHSGVPHPHAGG
jgi:deferrochelatase/peroxidase EfeB